MNTWSPWCGIRLSFPKLVPSLKSFPSAHAPSSLLAASPKQASGQVALRQQQPVVAGVLDQPPTRLDEALLETGQRPTINALGEHQPPPEVPEVVGQHAQLQPGLIRPEPALAARRIGNRFPPPPLFLHEPGRLEGTQVETSRLDGCRQTLDVERVRPQTTRRQSVTETRSHGFDSRRL